MDYSKICYKQTCLSQVIMRIDFLEFIDNGLLFSDTMEKVLIPNYPQRGKQQLVRYQTMNFTVAPEGEKTEKTSIDGLQQEFANSDGNKIVIANKYIVLELNQYTSYENELNKFLPVLRTIMLGANVTAIRTGIRYINEFGRNGIKAQKSYFTMPAAAFVDSKIMTGEKLVPIRTMALNEFVVDDMRLNFRYGQYNPQYPQPMRQVSFVLDFDCFCEEPLKGLESLIEHINKGHDAIQKLFESTITNKLRQVLQNG